MTPLLGHAGWGGIVEAIACMFLCSQVWIVGLALAGAVFRSPVLVGFSFVPAVAVVTTIELSGAGYAVWAITLLARWQLPSTSATTGRARDRPTVRKTRR
ncbi:hypothetical protein FTUN_4548 [Frigoriglobus tundricola]|uniref:Uncharacterized protein n=1 Tax=Frigoriglobus tundricola TaxID=2774151 RepID=A0A6M5YSL2_9BACT|nr:hypothetical protein FTUN_4548 [Frigoriglobus tundricola]